MINDVLLYIAALIVGTLLLLMSGCSTTKFVQQPCITSDISLQPLIVLDPRVADDELISQLLINYDRLLIDRQYLDRLLKTCQT